MSVGNLETSRSQETRYLTCPSLILTMKLHIHTLIHAHTLVHAHTHTHTQQSHLLWIWINFTITLLLTQILSARSSLSFFPWVLPPFPPQSGCSSSNGVCCGSSRNGHYHPRITGRGLHTADSEEKREREVKKVPRMGEGGQKKGRKGKDGFRSRI